MFAYDTSSASDRYTFDAAGQRLERTVNSLTYDYVFDNQGHENTKGAVGFASWHWSELYLGGLHVNTYTNGSTYFSHADHLGSERMETDPTGNTNSSAETNLPFGEWTSNAFQSELGFTGDLLDDADGDVFHTPNRQYSQTQGRWLTPDPAGLAAVNPLDPQTWNRYAYVGNNPVSSTDPSGLVSIPNVGDYMGGGGGDFNCQQDGIDQSCATINSVLAGGGAAVCPNNNCLPQYIAGSWNYFGAWADGSSGYLPMSFAGFSTADVAALRLVPTSDCSHSGERRIVYDVTGPGSSSSSGWYVTEHQDPTYYAPPNGTSTDGPGQFDDLISGWSIGNSIQTFTLSRQDPRTNPGTGSVNAIVQLTIEPGQTADYGALGIWHGGSNGMIFIQGNSSGWADCSQQPPGYN